MRQPVEETSRDAILVEDAHVRPMMGFEILEPLPARSVPYERVDPFILVHEARFRLSELQGVTRSAGVERHVTFAGLVDNAVVARYCAAADLFIKILDILVDPFPQLRGNKVAKRVGGEVADRTT